ncbi:MAG: C40 family peptidase [Gemmatimonadales bacterium]
MARRRIIALGALLGALTLCPASAEAQGGFGVSYGWWVLDDPAYIATGTYQGRLFGPIDFGLGVFHLNDRRSAVDRTQTGGELSLGFGRVGSGLYGFGAAALGVRHEDGNADAAWTLGVGYQLRPFSFLALGVDAAYRWEDTQVRGFWQLDPSDRKGFVLQGRIAIGGGSRRSARGGGSGSPTGPPPSTAEPREHLPPDGTADDVSSESAVLARSVVETAMEAMGSPYRWGGSDENGYDCSGLIQWAYGEHGIVLPRTSRDQARMGIQVERAPAALSPGDILGFAASGSGVSHVGLYVGGGEFIHSSSAGVRLSSLSATDPDSRWWQQRWVSARRILH